MMKKFGWLTAMGLCAVLSVWLSSAVAAGAEEKPQSKSGETVKQESEGKGGTQGEGVEVPQQKTEGVSGEEVKEKAKETYEAAKAYTLEQKEEYEKKIDTELANLNREIEKLKAKAEKEKPEVKAKLNEQIKELQKKQEVAQKKFDELKKASEKAWEQAKAQVDAAIKDVEDFFNRTFSGSKSK